MSEKEFGQKGYQEMYKLDDGKRGYQFGFLYRLKIPMFHIHSFFYKKNKYKTEKN